MTPDGPAIWRAERYFPTLYVGIARSQDAAVAVTRRSIRAVPIAIGTWYFSQNPDSKVKYENHAGENDGKWFFTEYSNQAKKKIYFVEYENQDDLKIYFVEYENQDGWRNKEKIHLMD